MAKLQIFDGSTRKVSEFMTTYKLYMNKDKRSGGRGIDLVDFVIYTGRIGRCLEREYSRRLREKIIRI